MALGMMWRRRRLTGQHYGTRIATTARPIPFGGDQRGLQHPEVIVYHVVGKVIILGRCMVSLRLTPRRKC